MLLALLPLASTNLIPVKCPLTINKEFVLVNSFRNFDYRIKFSMTAIKKIHFKLKYSIKAQIQHI